MYKEKPLVPAMVLRNMRYSKLEISLRCHLRDMFELRKSCRGVIMEGLRLCAIPYLIPTPTRGNVLIIRFTVPWSGNAKNTEAARKK